MTWTGHADDRWGGIVGVVILWLSLAVACVVVSSLVRQLRLFPSGLDRWRHAFSAEYREHRKALHAARQDKQREEDKVRQKVAVIERRSQEAERDCEQRVRALKQERHDLENPRAGYLQDGLGLLQLYEHVVVVLERIPEEGEKPHVAAVKPLAGLRSETKTVKDQLYIELEWPDGTRLSRPYEGPHSDRCHPTATVVAFAERIHNQAREEDDFLRWRHHRLAKIAAEINHIEAHTAAEQEKARLAVDELLNVKDPQQIAADAAWRARCDDWQKLTGHPPPLHWWRRSKEASEIHEP